VALSEVVTELRVDDAMTDALDRARVSVEAFGDSTQQALGQTAANVAPATMSISGLGMQMRMVSGLASMFGIQMGAAGRMATAAIRATSYVVSGLITTMLPMLTIFAAVAAFSYIWKRHTDAIKAQADEVERLCAQQERLQQVYADMGVMWLQSKGMSREATRYKEEYEHLARRNAMWKKFQTEWKKIVTEEIGIFSPVFGTGDMSTRLSSMKNEAESELELMDTYEEMRVGVRDKAWADEDTKKPRAVLDKTLEMQARAVAAQMSVAGDKLGALRVEQDKEIAITSGAHQRGELDEQNYRARLLAIANEYRAKRAEIMTSMHKTEAEEAERARLKEEEAQKARMSSVAGLLDRWRASTAPPEATVTSLEAFSRQLVAKEKPVTRDPTADEIRAFASQESFNDANRDRLLQSILVMLNKPTPPVPVY